MNKGLFLSHRAPANAGRGCLPALSLRKSPCAELNVCPNTPRGQGCCVNLFPAQVHSGYSAQKAQLRCIVPTLCQTPTPYLQGYCLFWKGFPRGSQIPARIKVRQSNFLSSPTQEFSKQDGAEVRTCYRPDVRPSLSRHSWMCGWV